MITDKNFAGRNGFFWFTGVVEDRHDPQYLGYVDYLDNQVYTSESVLDENLLSRLYLV